MGGASGGTAVDRAFEELMTSLLDDEVMTSSEGDDDLESPAAAEARANKISSWNNALSGAPPNELHHRTTTTNTTR